MEDFLLTEGDIKNWRQRVKAKHAGAEGEADYFRPALPYRLLEIEPEERSWTNRDGEHVVRTDQRIYRFFGYIGTRRGGKRRTGGYFEDVVADTTFWHRLMVLKLYNGLATAERLPYGLRIVPVLPSESALGRAARVNAKATAKQRAIVSIDPEYGVMPTTVYWAAAMVDDVVDKDGDRDTFPALVMMSEYQARLLGGAFNNFRSAPSAPDGWTGAGAAVRVHKVDTGTPGGALEVTPVKGESEWDMTRQDAPDPRAMISSIRSELAAYLRAEGAEIADFPAPGDNPDGWSSRTPIALQQWHMADDMAPEPMTVVLEGKAAAAVEEPANDLGSLTKRELLDMAVAAGVEVKPRMSREALISAIESTVS